MTNDVKIFSAQLIVVFAIIAAAFAGEQGARQERAIVSYSSWPYAPTAAYAPTAYSAYTGYPSVSTYSAWPATGYYGGVYGGGVYGGNAYGVPVARALW